MKPPRVVVMVVEGGEGRRDPEGGGIGKEAKEADVGRDEEGEAFGETFGKAAFGGGETFGKAAFGGGGGEALVRRRRRAEEEKHSFGGGETFVEE